MLRVVPSLVLITEDLLTSLPARHSQLPLLPHFRSGKFSLFLRGLDLVALVYKVSKWSTKRRARAQLP